MTGLANLELGDDIWGVAGGICEVVTIFIKMVKHLGFLGEGKATKN